LTLAVSATRAVKGVKGGREGRREVGGGGVAEKDWTGGRTRKNTMTELIVGIFAEFKLFRPHCLGV